MRNLLLVLHVAGAIMFLGPTTVATSRFGRHADGGDVAAAADAHRTSRAYGTASIVVPGVGFALAQRSDTLGEPWVVAAIALFAAGAVVLAAVHLPAQAAALARLRRGDPVGRGILGRLRASAGLYGTSWLVIVWLMIAKPS